MGRKMALLVAVVLAAAPLALAADYPREGQLLVNPGFDLDENGDGLPDGWSTTPTQSRLRETVFMGGNYELVSVGNSYVLATQDLRLEPGETYTISMSVRGSGGGIAGALIVHGEETPTSEMPLLWNVAVDTEFAEVGRSFVAPNPVARLYIYNIGRTGEVAYDWVSLVKGEAPRAYVNTVNFGERDLPDSEPLVRERITRWARPLAGGPLRALISIYVLNTMRDTVELGHRLEMDADVMQGGYGGDLLYSTDGRRITRRMEADDYEVYVIASRLDERFERDIRAQVEAGAGLVVISGFARLGNYCAPDDLQPVADDHYLMRDLPWEYLPRHILREVRVGQIGAGRVVWLNFPTEVARVWGLLPVENDHAAWMTRELRFWEYWYGFLARALQYAARGESGIELAPLPDRPGVRVTGAPVGATVEVTLRHSRELRWGEPEVGFAPQTGPADAPLYLQMPADAPEGVLLADTIVRDAQGRVLYWGMPMYVSGEPAATITRVELSAESYAPGEPVVAGVGVEPAPPAGSVLQGRLVDSWGRVVAETAVPARGRTELELTPPAEDLLTAGHKLFVKLLNDGREIDSAWTDVYFPSISVNAPRQDWHISTWGDGMTNPYTSAGFSQMLLELGFSGKFGSWLYATGEFPLVPGIHSRAGRVFSGSATTEDGVRTPCLSNPEVIAQYTTEAPEEIAQYRRYGPFAINICDEATLANRAVRREVCFSEWCRSRYCEWLRAQYGAIAALNAEWGTNYASFDDIRGATTEEVRGTANFAPFVDFRTFMTDVWVEGMRDITRVYGEAAPEVLVGHTNTFGAMPTNGNDYWKLCTRTGFGWAQEYSEAIKGSAQKAVFELWRSFLQGRTGEDWPNYGWIGYDHRPQAVTYEPWWLAFHDSGGVTYYATNSVSAERGKSWSLIYPTQAFTPYAREVAATLTDLREGVGKALLDARRAEPQVAILWSHPSMLVAWCESTWMQPEPPESAVDDSYGSYYKSAFYFRLALQELQLMYNYVAPEQILAGELSKYQVLFLPFTCALSDELAEALLAWVEGGGTLIADVRLAITDEHGAPRNDDLLERLMGVRRMAPGATYEPATVTGPGSFVSSVREALEVVAAGAETVARYEDGTPAVVGRGLGAGHTIYLNCLLPKYDPTAVQMVGDLMDGAGVERRVTVDSGDPEAPALAWECARYELGLAEIVGLIRDHRLCAEPQTCTVDFGRVAHIYDMRRREYLGETRAIETTLAPGEAACFAVLPYRVTGVQLTGAGRDLRATVLAEGEVGPHVLHVSVTDPAGNPAPAYARNVSAPDGVADLHVPLAANDPVGTWTVSVRDALSGATAQATVAWPAG